MNTKFVRMGLPAGPLGVQNQMFRSRRWSPISVYSSWPPSATDHVRHEPRHILEVDAKARRPRRDWCGFSKLPQRHKGRGGHSATVNRGKPNGYLYSLRNLNALGHSSRGLKAIATSCPPKPDSVSIT